MKIFQTVIFIIQIVLFTVRVQAGKTLFLNFYNSSKWEFIGSNEYELFRTDDGGSVIIDIATMRSFQIQPDGTTKTYSLKEMMDIIQSKHPDHPIEIVLPAGTVYPQFGKITNIKQIEIDTSGKYEDGFVAKWEFTFIWNRNRIWQPVLLDEKYCGFLNANEEQVELITSLDVIEYIRKLLVQPSFPGLLVQFVNVKGEASGDKNRFFFEKSNTGTFEEYFDKYKFKINYSDAVPA